MREKNVHFIGIGGISMSGIAEILHRDGKIISGSDDMESENTRRLASLGITVKIPNAAENITEEIDLVVYTAAVKPDNAEFLAAKRMGLELVERAEYLGRLLRGYDAVCVAGSHGKTTTTSMISEVAIAAGLDPTIQIGGHMNATGMNYRIGNSRIFILEACEYSNSFHHWQPKVGIILNIDADHLDFFGNMDNLIDAFAKFASNIRKDGVLVIKKGVTGYKKIVNAAKCEIITFSSDDNNCTSFAKNISYNAEKPVFDVVESKDEKEFLRAKISLNLPGEYNMMNALACFAAATWLGIDPKITATALEKATGTKRRFEYKGSFRGARVVDDYAHHPTEIVAALAAARRSMGENGGRIFCLFQPHTYTRTKNLLDEFAVSFSDADIVLLLPIYAAREPFDPQISSQMLAERIEKRAVFLENFDKAGNYLKEHLRENDLLLTMGAGDVHIVGENLLHDELSTFSTDCDE